MILARVHRVVRLRGQPRAVAGRADPRPDRRFAAPAAVRVRRVEPADAGVPGGVHDREGLLLRLSAPEQLRGRADPAEVAAPEDDPRHAPSLRWSRGGLDLPRRQPGSAADAARRLLPARLRGSALQHRSRADATDARDRRGHRWRPHRLQGPPLLDAPSRGELVPRLVRRLPRLPRAAPARAPPAPPSDRNALPPPRLPRGSLRQAPLRRALRPRAVLERDHLGLRLRRARQAPLAGQARHDPRLREGRAGLLLRLRGRRPRAVHGAGARHGREGRQGQAADRRVLAHDRFADRQGENSLPDTETARRDPPLRPGLYPRRRLVPRSVRGQRHARSRRRRARPALRPRRFESRGGAGDGAAPRARARAA